MNHGMKTVALALAILAVGIKGASAEEGKKSAETKPAEAPAPSAPSLAGAPTSTQDTMSGFSTASQFKIGGEYFYGMSNLNGPWKKETDGVWKGQTLFVPSHLDLVWSKGFEGVNVSYPVGELAGSSAYTGPIELSYHRRVGDGIVKIGKFYNVFGTVDYEAETHFGVQYLLQRGKTNYIASVQQNSYTYQPQLTFRVGRLLDVKHETQVGLSLGAGRGFLFGSPNDLALGVDVEHNFGFASFSLESSVAGGKGTTFQMLNSQLTFKPLGNFTPSLGFISWHDGSQYLGQYEAVTFGVDYQVSKHLSVGGNLARTGGHDILWFQSRTAF